MMIHWIIYIRYLKHILFREKNTDYHKQIQSWNNDRNSIFVKKFHAHVDSCPDFNETYHAFIQKHIKPLFPDDTQLVVQKTPNIRFSFPDSAAIRCDPNRPRKCVSDYIVMQISDIMKMK
jgi:hypothetical protein